jgi:hypothetical protein
MSGRLAPVARSPHPWAPSSRHKNQDSDAGPARRWSRSHSPYYDVLEWLFANDKPPIISSPPVLVEPLCEDCSPTEWSNGGRLPSRPHPRTLGSR